MDVPNISRKRPLDDGEISLNDANASQGSEGVNKNLLKCLVVLTKHIIDVHKNKNELVRYDTHTVIKSENDGSSDIDITEHNIRKQPDFHVPMDDTLSKNISLLKEQTAELEKIYNKPQYNGSRDSLNQTNYTTIDNLLRANVVQHLSENSANLTEQICNLISMYKSEQSQENARNIRKCLSKINKKIKSIPLQSDVVTETTSDVFFSTFNKSNLSDKANAYLTAAHNLSDKLSVLIKKVSKLKKVYKKRVLNTNVNNNSEPAVKKRKSFHISNNESIVIDDNDVTLDNVGVEHLNCVLEKNCSTPKIVKKSNQTTNTDELNAISIVTNEKSTEETSDKSISQPLTSNYVNDLLDSYLAITNKGKLKRKSRKKSVLNENSGNNCIVVEALIHTEKVTNEVKTKQKTTNNNNNETQDVVIQIESDDNSVEILVENNENSVVKVSVESPKKTVKTKRKSVENTNDNTREILIQSNTEENSKKTVSKKKSVENTQEILVENYIETISEESPKKTVKKKRKSVENSNNFSENTHEILVENNENSTETVSEESPKKTVKKKKKCVENSNEKTQEISINNIENTSETVSEGNPKKTVKKKRKSVENLNQNCSEILVEKNENYTDTVSEESRKKAAKKKRKSVENSIENTEETLIENNDTSVDVNDLKSRKKKRKKKRKSDDGMTETILNDILHHICAHVVEDNENDALTVQENNESEVQSATKKRKKDKSNKENVIVLAESDNVENTTKVKRKKKISKDSEGKVQEILNKSRENDVIVRKKMPKIRIRSMEYIDDDFSELIKVKKKKRKSGKKEWKSVEFIEEDSVEMSVPNNDVDTVSLLDRKSISDNEVLNDLETTPLLERKNNNMHAILTKNHENDCETNNEHVVKKKHKKKRKSMEIIDVKSPGIPFEYNENTAEVVSDESSKKTVKKNKKSKEHYSLEKNESSVDVNSEINCKRKEKKSKKSIENTEIILAEHNETSGYVNNEISSKKKHKKLAKSLETVKTESAEKIDKVNIDITNHEIANNDISKNDIIEQRRSKGLGANMDKENVPQTEQLREKSTDKLSASNVENNEIPDDMFSSVFKIEPPDDVDDLQTDLNLTFVSLNSSLLDEDLDEREQYLYLRELVETAKEKLELSESTKDRLRELCVLLDFDVPAAHTIENRLCAGPSREQAEKLAALGVRSGPLGRDEDDIIRRNWTAFCKTHDLPDDPTPFLALQHGQQKIISYEDRRKFVQYLGKDLPHRALHSIYRRFKLLFKVTKDGRFSEDEDLLILSYVKFSGHNAKFADLTPVLNRPRAAIEARYRALNKGSQRVTWDLNLKADLIKHMKQVMEVENVNALQYADITHAHLAEVAKRMNLPVVKIRHQWCTKLYTQLFAAKPLYLDQMKVDLVERLHELKINDWRKVNWCEVAKTFPGVSPVSLRVLMKTLFRYNCPRKLQADLGAIITYCRTVAMPELKARPEFNQRHIHRLKIKKDGSLKEYV